MGYWAGFSSPLGEMTLVSQGTALTGLWWDDCPMGRREDGVRREDLPVFLETKAALACYFSKQPLRLPPLMPQGTPFRRGVWEKLLAIPYGTVTTYGALAKSFGQMSPQAIGGAVGHNPISIFIPCHRVVGANSLTGYAGGLWRKEALLRLEGAL